MNYKLLFWVYFVLFWVFHFIHLSETKQLNDCLNNIQVNHLWPAWKFEQLCIEKGLAKYDEDGKIILIAP